MASISLTKCQYTFMTCKTLYNPVLYYLPASIPFPVTLRQPPTGLLSVLQASQDHSHLRVFTPVPSAWNVLPSYIGMAYSFHSNYYSVFIFSLATLNCWGGKLQTLFPFPWFIFLHIAYHSSDSIWFTYTLLMYYWSPSLEGKLHMGNNFYMFYSQHL